MEQPYYIAKIKERLSQRKSSNSSYSLRAYARDLGLHSASLSQILNGKRKLPIKKAHQVAEKLNLSPKEMRLFMESFYKSKSSLDDIKVGFWDKRQILDESHFTIISEWEHYAALELFHLKDFCFSSKNVSKKLNIGEDRAELVIQNLLDSNLLSTKLDGSFRPTYSDIKTTEDVTSRAIQKAHQKTLEVGIKKLEEIDVSLRDFSSITLAVDLEKIQEAKNIIREFRQKMNSLFKGTNPTEVFTMAIQFYPISDIKEGSGK